MKRSSLLQHLFMSWKIKASSAAAVLLGSVLVFLAFRVASGALGAYLTPVILVLGASAGWLLGILLSPYDKDQKARFSRYAMVFLFFACGYFVAKIHRVVDRGLAAEFGPPPLAGFRVIAFGSALLLGLLVTLVYRKYARARRV